MIATLLLSLGSIRSTAATPENGGPFNVQILAGGIGVSRELAATDRITAANAPWSLSAWVRPDILAGDPILLALGNAGTFLLGSGATSDLPERHTNIDLAG